jgi:methylated-DNA-protein-cysteine methyltransferase-like protein
MPPTRLFLRVKADVLALLHDIPAGRVTTYGAIAESVGVRPRYVARVLATMSDGEAEGVPWHRVVGAGGVISTMQVPGVGERQIALLHREGVRVSERNRIVEFATVFFTPG